MYIFGERMRMRESRSAPIASTRKRNDYINQFSKNKRMINYMKALDVIAATAAGMAGDAGTAV